MARSAPPDLGPSSSPAREVLAVEAGQLVLRPVDDGGRSRNPAAHYLPGTPRARCGSAAYRAGVTPNRRLNAAMKLLTDV